MMTYAGSSRAHWFFVCLWYEVCRYLQQMHARLIEAEPCALHAEMRAA